MGTLQNPDAYQKLAPIYDAVSGGFLRGPRSLLVDTCVRLGARRVLDTGCGTGMLTAMLKERTDFVVGLDRSPAMLAARTMAVNASNRRLAAGKRPSAPVWRQGLDDKSLRSVSSVKCSGQRPESGAAARDLLFVRGDAARPPFAPGSFDALLYALVLHETRAEPDALLEAGFALAPLALVLEWRMPERNLDLALTFWVGLIERLAGREHFRRFRAFMRAGGVRGLAGRVGASILEERAMAGNSLVLAVLRRGRRIIFKRETA